MSVSTTEDDRVETFCVKREKWLRQAPGRFFVTVSFLMTVLTVSPVLAMDTIKIGAILALSSSAADIGAPEAKTLEMLVEDINKKGGVKGKQIELIIKDSGASAEKAVSYAKRLIEEDKVFAIIGPSTSGATLKVKRIAEEGKTIVISCAAAEEIVNPVAKYVFQTPQMDRHAVIMIFDRMKKMGISKIGVLSSNTGFGRAGKTQIEKLAPEYGITILVNEVYDKGASDFTAEVTKLKRANVQALINWSIEPAQSIVMKNVRQTGLTIPMFQSHGFGNIEYVKAAGPAAEGVIFPEGRLLIADALPEDHPQRAVLLNYKRNYESKYYQQAALPKYNNKILENKYHPEEVSAFGGYAYDALMILVKAIETAGLDKEKVRSAIENMKGFTGVDGIFNFSSENHNGLDIEALEMLTVKNGKFVIYKE